MTVATLVEDLQPLEDESSVVDHNAEGTEDRQVDESETPETGVAPNRSRWADGSPPPEHNKNAETEIAGLGLPSKQEVGKAASLFEVSSTTVDASGLPGLLTLRPSPPIPAWL